MRATSIILPPFEYYSQRNKFYKIFHVVFCFSFLFFYLFHFSVDASGSANTAEGVEVVQQLNRPLSVVPFKPFITPVGRSMRTHSSTRIQGKYSLTPFFIHTNFLCTAKTNETRREKKVLRQISESLPQKGAEQSK